VIFLAESCAPHKKKTAEWSKEAWHCLMIIGDDIIDEKLDYVKYKNAKGTRG